MKSEIVEFSGIKFYRYPDAKDFDHRRYFASSSENGNKRLHREVWRSIHGEIPEGGIVHHIDGNTLNNNPDNLCCLTNSAHTHLHDAKDPERIGKRCDGRARSKYCRICRYCGKEYETPMKESAYCCKKHCNKDWYDKNCDKILAQHRDYYIENREEIRVAQKEYWARTRGVR